MPTHVYSGKTGSNRTRSKNPSLQKHLNDAGVKWTSLTNNQAFEAEETWRAKFADAFLPGHRRGKTGRRAFSEYMEQKCKHYMIVRFTMPLEGTPITGPGLMMEAYECKGPLTDLSGFHSLEFFISPMDFTWTMVHCHEDHVLAGPYFVKE